MNKSQALDELLAQIEADNEQPVGEQAMARAVRLRDDVLAKAARTAGAAGAEVKTFEVRRFCGDKGAFVLIEVGRVGDEGTLAALWCREYRHIAIGPSGGLKLLNAKNRSKANGRFNALWGATC